jgi:GxxExxY protein
MITPSISNLKSETSKRDPQTYALIGAGLAVYNELGHGFLEAVFQDAFEIELEMQSILFVREHPFELQYKGRPLKSSYRCDFFCFGEVIVEIKATKAISDVEVAQVINYLKASKTKRPVLLNFGAPSLEYRRIVLDLPETPSENLRKSAKSAVKSPLL